MERSTEGPQFSPAGSSPQGPGVRTMLEKWAFLHMHSARHAWLLLVSFPFKGHAGRVWGVTCLFFQAFVGVTGCVEGPTGDRGRASC